MKWDQRATEIQENRIFCKKDIDQSSLSNVVAIVSNSPEIVEDEE